MSIIKEVTDWSFTNADTQYMTHGLHPYPARMIPQVAHRLIENYSSASVNSLILDPFCGSGTVLVESRLLGRNCIGIDVNPLAILIAKAKTIPIEPKRLKDSWELLKRRISNEITKLRLGMIDIKPLEIKEINIDFWFKPKVQKELTIIRNNLDILKEEDYEDCYNFFATCFSYTVRKSSNLRDNEFKIYRISKDKLQNHNPDVYTIFVNWVEKNIPKMNEYYNAVNNQETTYELRLEDSRYMSIDSNTVDLIVTSPPYGDSRTTVAYGQYSRFSSLWLGLPSELVMNVDKRSLGGNHCNLDTTLESYTLTQILDMIESRDKERAKEILAYFNDLYLCLKQTARVLKEGCHACYVIGNRTVKRIRIPTDIIIVELGEKLGLKYNAIFYRNIPTKRMPWENSPENIVGMKSNTIAEESIIVLKK
jgi:DNA modification methylase